MNARKRLAVEAMLDPASGLYVYVGVDGTEDSVPLRADWPPSGSGAIVHDCVEAPCPMPVSRKIVAGLRRYGTTWDRDRKCEVMTDEGRVLARAEIAGRDYIWLGRPGELPAAHADGGGR